MKASICGIVKIISHETESDYYYKYYAKSSQNDKFIIYIKKSENNIFKIGTELKINGKFEFANGARNTGGFNYRLYLNSNNVHGIIKVSSFEIINYDTNNIVYLLQNKIRDTLLKLFPQNIDYAGVLNGMLIGETNDISSEVQTLFKEGGITHLLAVSGSNVAVVVLVSKSIFSKIVGKQYSNYFSILFIIFFVLLSGSSPSVLRAGIMAILAICANIFVRKSNSINNIFSSALIILIINPITLANTGFILSFFGTIGIVSCSKYLNRKLSKYIQNKTILDTLSVTLSAQIILLPIMAYFFNSISLLSIFTNLLVVPVSGILTIVGLVLILISLISFNLAKLFSVIPYLMIKYIITITNLSTKFNFLNFVVPTPKLWMVLLFYALLYIIVFQDQYKNSSYIKRMYYHDNYKLILKIKNIVFKIIVVIFVVSILIKLLPRNYIQVTAIDVGQGDAFLVETSHKKTILIDGGGSERGDYDVGANILLPYLLNRNIMKIDMVIISHAHADHIDGIFTVLENLKVEMVLIGPQKNDDELIKKLYEICDRRNVNIVEVCAGDSLQIDDIKFEILYPEKNYTDSNINNLSLVIKMYCNIKTMLFTGDVEKESENIINYDISADILKVAHHGAKTSSSENFINRVRPKIALIGVSENNTYGHPNSDVVKRIEEYAEVFMTKDSGEIRLKIYRNGEIKVFEFLKK